MKQSTQAPERSCLGCGAKKPQRALLRVASQGGSTPVLDESGKAPGRGAYLCREVACLERGFARKALERSLKLKAGLPDALKARLLVEMRSR